MIKSLQVRQGVLSNYLLDDFRGFNEEEDEEEGLAMDDPGDIHGGTNKTYLGGAAKEKTEPAMKANLAYVICMAISSHRYAWDKVFNARNPHLETAGQTAIINAIKEERKLLDKILKKAQDPGKSPGATGAGDIDQNLRRYVLAMIPKTSWNEKANFFASWISLNKLR